MKKRVLELNKSVMIEFSPVLDESKIVRMVAPEKHKLGEFIKIIYPDGTVVSDGSVYPDIRKMGE